MYRFDKSVVMTLSKKYGIEIPIDSPLYGSQQGQHCRQTVNQVDHVDNDETSEGV